jgi:hypothetical protein
MRKLIFFCLFFLLSATPTHALSQFTTNYQISYQVNPSGLTHVKFDISQTNNLSRVYATEFSLSVSHTDIENLKVKDITTTINPDITLTNNITNINFPFSNKVVGVGKTHNFSIEYDTQDIAIKTGSVWEINIPKITTKESINNLEVTLAVPPDFPQLAYIDPKPKKITNNLYTFSSNSLANKSISVLFGTEQFFKLNASYYLKNELSSTEEKTIALPPNTSYQEVYIKKIDPTPENITQDQDGNWLATYTLKPKQELNIELEEIIKLNFVPQKTNPKDLTRYLQPTQVWDFNSPQFQKINATEIKDPQQIFNFTTSSLIYNYSLVNKDPLQRQTASFSLEHPTQAICTNFTDLFVALARKNNIPAREIQGFAMSKNDKLKPISLSKDVLHAWPEYFNQETSTWTQVDPTWTNTTNGVDYFNKLDLNHITFVIHGDSSVEPLPAGFYKNPEKTTKDISLEEIDPVNLPEPNIQVEVKQQKGNTLVVGVTNLSGTAKLNIPPLSYQEIEVGLNSRPIIGKSTKNVTLEIAGTKYNLPVSVKPILEFKTIVIISVLSLILLILIIKKIKGTNSVFPVSIKT